MTTTTATSDHARRMQAAKDAREQARHELAANRADTTTPLGATPPAFPMETLPDPPTAAPAAPAAPVPAPCITLATTIQYRDYPITITATGMKLDAFCDMLDKRLGVVNE